MIDNVATDASVSQSPTGSRPANLANDGDKSSCSKTNGTNVRFQVDMSEIRIVTEISFTGKGMFNIVFFIYLTLQHVN